MALQLVLALVFLWTNTFEALLSYIGFTLSASTALTVCGLIRLKRRSPDLAVIGWPIVPSLFLVFVSWSLIFSFGRLGWAGLWGIGTMAIGWLIWRIQTARFPRL
jgi:APA family basic amino acid/polyamine antiporter